MNRLGLDALRNDLDITGPRIYGFYLTRVLITDITCSQLSRA
jgi:hypothetical protein